MGKPAEPKPWDYYDAEKTSSEAALASFLQGGRQLQEVFASLPALTALIASLGTLCSQAQSIQGWDGREDDKTRASNTVAELEKLLDDIRRTVRRASLSEAVQGEIFLDQIDGLRDNLDTVKSWAHRAAAMRLAASFLEDAAPKKNKQPVQSLTAASVS